MFGKVSIRLRKFITNKSITVSLALFSIVNIILEVYKIVQFAMLNRKFQLSIPIVVLSIDIVGNLRTFLALSIK